MTISFFKVRDNARIPSRAHKSDAGLDLYFCAAEGSDSISIFPGETVLMGTGVKAEIPYGFFLEVKNKSSIAAKRQLLVGACVVDAGYDGEIFVNLHNVGDSTQVFQDGDKVAQGVLIPVLMCNVEEATDDSAMNAGSSRGNGALGSTGER